MKITLCCSIAFIDEMEELAGELKALGHEVKFPPVELTLGDGTKVRSSEHYKHKKKTRDNDTAMWQRVQENIVNHFDEVAWSEAILVCNFDKHGVRNYLGPSTLMEMGLALYLKKKVFLLQPVPEVEWKEEILGIGPTIIENDLKKIV